MVTALGATAGDFVSQTFACWLILDVAAGTLLAKDRDGNKWGCSFETAAQINWNRRWTTGGGNWRTNASHGAGELLHLAVTYDGSSTSADPTIYVDGTAVAMTKTTSPSGSFDADAANSLLAGEAGSGDGDFDGAMGWLCYANAVWTAAQVNRARWWGRPGGAQAVYHPLVTDKLANEGTATADGTATGTTLRSIPRVERCWGILMGCGR